MSDESPSAATLRGRWLAVVRQRDLALNEIVMHLGEIEHLREQLAAALQQIAEHKTV